MLLRTVVVSHFSRERVHALSSGQVPIVKQSDCQPREAGSVATGTCTVYEQDSRELLCSWADGLVQHCYLSQQLVQVQEEYQKLRATFESAKDTHV